VDIDQAFEDRTMPDSRRVRYNADMLAAALATSKNLKEVVAALGLEDSPYRRRYVSEKIREYGLDQTRLRSSRHKYTPELLSDAASRCLSVKGVVRHLGLQEAGGTEAHISRQLKKFGIDTSHFLGQAHNRGKKRGPRRTAHQILVKNPSGSGRVRCELLRRALADLGLEARCAGCGTGPSWRGKAMTLEIDHINGDLTDNRLGNLRYLCPNCHATTDNYCRRKQTTKLGLDLEP
jgi:hypothetical protein